MDRRPNPISGADMLLNDNSVVHVIRSEGWDRASGLREIICADGSMITVIDAGLGCLCSRCREAERRIGSLLEQAVLDRLEQMAMARAMARWEQMPNGELLGPTREAMERAEKLLASLLTPEQYTTYSTSGWFDIKVSAMSQEFRIFKCGAYNVMSKNTGRRYCAVLADSRVPLADTIVAQVLALRNNPDHFFRVANIGG